jgi:hypothetical protein
MEQSSCKYRDKERRLKKRDWMAEDMPEAVRVKKLYVKKKTYKKALQARRRQDRERERGCRTMRRNRGWASEQDIDDRRCETTSSLATCGLRLISFLDELSLS